MDANWCLPHIIATMRVTPKGVVKKVKKSTAQWFTLHISFVVYKSQILEFLLFMLCVLFPVASNNKRCDRFSQNRSHMPNYG